MKIREHVPLAPLTTFGVGGTARFFVAPHSIEDVQEALSFAQEKKLPIFVLGGGSNIVVADSGFDGLVIHMHIAGITTETRGDRVWVTAGAGIPWDDLVVWSIEHKLCGLECLSGVPSTVGGAVVANLGAYGAQVSDTFVHVDVFNTRDSSRLRVIAKEECDFSYHDSLFARESGRYVVLRATFSLSHDPKAQLSYRDNRFNMAALAEKLGHTPTPADIREAVLHMREEKGSLIMPGRLSYKSAGSFFHMPFVSKAQYEQVVARARALDAAKEERFRPWAWEQVDGTYKLAPGFLLEYTKFQKGYTQGGAGISPRHTLSIINVGDARACDIAQLAQDMQNAVENIFGIQLEREVEYIGVVE